MIRGGLMSKIPDWVSDVGPGWRPILDLLHKDISRVAPNYEVSQLKEKFGMLRVYYSALPEKYFEYIFELTGVAEMASAEICEQCGHPGKVRPPPDSSAGWLLALCDRCNAGRGLS